MDAVHRQSEGAHRLQISVTVSSGTNTNGCRRSWNSRAQGEVVSHPENMSIGHSWSCVLLLGVVCEKGK